MAPLGVYLFLFMAAIPTFAWGDVLKAQPLRVFLAGNALMFIVISIHNCKPALIFEPPILTLSQLSPLRIQYLASFSLLSRSRTRLTFEDLSRSSTTCLSGVRTRPQRY
jgi:hypothetical protein